MIEKNISSFLESFLSVFLSLPKFGRRAAHAPPERRAKSTEASVADRKRNLGYRQRRTPQQALGELKPMVEEEVLDPEAGVRRESTVGVVSPEAAVVDEGPGSKTFLEESGTKCLVDGLHVRRAVRIRRGQALFPVGGFFPFDDLRRRGHAALRQSVPSSGTRLRVH